MSATCFLDNTNCARGPVNLQCIRLLDGSVVRDASRERESGDHSLLSPAESYQLLDIDTGVLSSMPMWRGSPNTRTFPAILFTLPSVKVADMAHLCVPQNQALGVHRRFAPEYAALMGERVDSTQPSHQTQKKNDT